MLGSSRLDASPASRHVCRPGECAARLREPNRDIIQLALIATADLPADIVGFAQHGIQYALIALLGFVLEQAVKGGAG